MTPEDWLWKEINFLLYNLHLSFTKDSIIFSWDKDNLAIVKCKVEADKILDFKALLLKFLARWFWKIALYF